METKLGMLLGVMKAYSVLYSSADVANRRLLEKQWARLFRNAEVRRAVDDLLEFEVRH